MSASPEVKQLTDTIKSLSDEDVEKLARMLRKERKQRDLVKKKTAGEQGEQGGI